MKTLPILTFVNVTVSIILLLGGGYLFFNHVNILNEFLNRLPVIYTLLGVLITAMWHGINRLNSLDNLEGLKEEHIKLIQHHVAAIKRTLNYKMVWLILAALVLLISSSIRTLSPAIMDIGLSIIIPIIFTLIWLNTISYPALYQSIEDYRKKAVELCQKEKARRKLIDEIKKDRISQPLVLDPHLEGYRKIFDDGGN